MLHIEKDKERFRMNFKIVTPGLLEMFIFHCFHFAGWRHELSPDYQFRVTCGALAIAVSFLIYYGMLFYHTIRSEAEHRTRDLLYIAFYAFIGFSSFFISYFMTLY